MPQGIEYSFPFPKGIKTIDRPFQQLTAAPDPALLLLIVGGRVRGDLYLQIPSETEILQGNPLIALVGPVKLPISIQVVLLQQVGAADPQRV